MAEMKDIRFIQEVSNSESLNDDSEHIRFLAAIDKGLEDFNSGRVVPHEAVKEWVKRCLPQ